MADVLVLGAGTAGLAAAATLSGIGVGPVVLEKADEVGASWRSRYDGLRLNTPGWMSGQPGFRATRRRYGEYPTRDAWIAYLEDYAKHHRVEVRFGTEVRRVVLGDNGWILETNRGEMEARYVVVATGFDHAPNMPDWPGRDGFTGELIHSSVYRNPEPYRDRDVLVVGPNTTGSEVANLISRGGARRVRLACRTPPNLVTRKFLGVPINIPGIALNRFPTSVGDQITGLMQRMLFGDLDQYGLPRSELGVATTMRRRRQAPAYDDGFIALLKDRQIEIVAAVVGFDGPSVSLADGTNIEPDAVIAATGYRRGLESLVGHLGVLDGDGNPLVNGGDSHVAAPGMFFTGYRADLSGQLRLMRLDARSIAKSVRRLRR